MTHPLTINDLIPWIFILFAQLWTIALLLNPKPNTPQTIVTTIGILTLYTAALGSAGYLS